MSAQALSYTVVTPVRNEERNLGTLARCLAEQSAPTLRWVIVDTGSTDETLALANDLSRGSSFIHVLVSRGALAPMRGGPIVRAFVAGLACVELHADIVVKLDADVTFESDYFARLLSAFARDPQLGIASGICYERENGDWKPLFGTRAHVWGASRAYRWRCLQEILPFEERQGWDEVDSIKAQLRGWRVGTVTDLPFFHQRPEGERDGARRRWADQGDTAYFMGYRFSYLLVRTLFRAAREPASIAMLGGYLRARLARRPVLGDAAVRDHLRDEQSVRMLPLRIREALGKAGSSV